MHEGIVGVTACDRRKPCRRKHVRGVEEGAAEAVADQMLRVQRVLAAIGVSCLVRLRARSEQLTAALSTSCPGSALGFIDKTVQMFGRRTWAGWGGTSAAGWPSAPLHVGLLG